MRIFLKARATATLALIATAAAMALPGTAAAAVSSVRTATTQPTYQNPATGQIEDSGGTSNQALGESMVSSTTDAHALVETDAAGKTYITLRVHLADQVQGVAVETSTDGGATFSAAEVSKAQEDLSHGEASQDNTSDWRFEAPSATAVLRVRLDVIPMGREVTYFVQLADLVDGNDYGFAASVTPGEGVADAEDSGSDSAADSKGDAAADSDAQGDLNDESGSDAEGISEYDADGNEVSDDAVKPLDAGTAVLIAAAVATVAAVAGGIYYAVVVRPRRATAAVEAAKAARAFGAATGAKPAVDGDDEPASSDSASEDK